MGEGRRGERGEFGPHFQLPSNCYFSERAGFIKFFDFSKNGLRVLDYDYKNFFKLFLPLKYEILLQYELNFFLGLYLM